MGAVQRPGGIGSVGSRPRLVWGWACGACGTEGYVGFVQGQPGECDGDHHRFGVWLAAAAVTFVQADASEGHDPAVRLYCDRERGLRLRDQAVVGRSGNGHVWSAGRYRPGINELDCVGMLIRSYTQTKVVYRLGVDYKVHRYQLAEGDPYQVSVNGALKRGSSTTPAHSSRPERRPGNLLRRHSGTQCHLAGWRCPIAVADSDGGG